MMNRPLISLEQAASQLGLLPSTIRAAIGRGFLHPDHWDEQTYWFQPEAIDRYGFALRRTSNAPPR